MFNRSVIYPCLLALGLLTLPLPATLPLESPTEDSTFLEKVLDFLGVSVTTGKLKGEDQEPEQGDIWIANLNSRIQRIRVTHDGGYRSPVFTPEDGDIVALKGNDLVRIPMFGAFGGEPEKLWTIPGIVKIVGFHQQDKDKILILSEHEDGLSVGVLSLTSGKVSPVPHESEARHTQMLIHLKNWERVYDGTRVYIKIQHKIGRAGEWTEVFIQRGDESPINVSQCDRVSCGQPSLSADGSQVVYIKAEDSSAGIAVP